MQDKHNLRTFYTILLTQVFSLIGSQMSGLAVGIWVYQETGNAAPLAFAAFFGTLPRVVMSGVAGVLADRWDRRYVMVIADIGQGLTTGFLMLVFLTDSFALWHLYTMSFLGSIFSAFQGPAFQASITMLIPDEHRDRANALQQLTGPASGVIAPIITGLVFTIIGVTGVMAIDMVTFFVAVGVILMVHIPRPEQTAEGAASRGSIWKEAFYGFRYLWNKRPLFVLVSYFSFVNFLANGVFILMTPYVIARTDSTELLGTLLGVMSMGAIVGGIFMSVWGGTRPRIHTVLPGIAFAGAFIAAYGLEMSPILMGAVLFIMMVPLPMVNAAITSILQLKVAPDIQGRVFAAIGQLASLMTPLAYLAAGPLADNVFEPAIGQSSWDSVAPLVGNEVGAGMGLMFVISGVLASLSAWVIYAIPSIRSMEADLPDYEPVTAPDDEALDVSEITVETIPAEGMAPAAS